MKATILHRGRPQKGGVVTRTGPGSGWIWPKM